MMLEVLKGHIVDIVRDVQGCKTTELVPRLEVRLERARFDQSYTVTASDLILAIEELVVEQKLLAFEYELTDHPEKTKMFLLPGDTRVRRMGRG